MIQIGGQTTVHTQNPFVNDSRNWQIVKHSAEFPPNGKPISPLTLVIEAVHPRDGTAFVISAQQENSVRVFDLVCQKKAHDLDALLASVDKVTHE